MKKLLILIFLIFLAGFGYKVYGSFSKSIWDGKNRINLVLINEKVFIFSLNPIERTAVFLSIPQQTFIEVIRGFGPYRIESVFKLGELENHRGSELLAGSIQENLGIPVDGFAVISNFQFLISNDKAKDHLLTALGHLLRNGKTNLTKWDLVRLWWKTRKIRQDKITVVELEKMGVLKELVLADETLGFQIDPEKMEKIAGNFFKDSKIRQEDLSIAILNSTNRPGKAYKGARLVRNIGGRVVEIGDVANSKCEIKSLKKLRRSYTVRKLIKIFNCQWGGDKLEGSRAEVVLILTEK